MRYIINGSVGKSVEKPFLNITSVENGIKANSKKYNILKLTIVTNSIIISNGSPITHTFSVIVEIIAEKKTSKVRTLKSVLF